MEGTGTGGSSGAIPLAGPEIHGFHTLQDLDVGRMMEEAKTRWLRPNEIHAVLYNHKLFTILVKPVHLPKSGLIVLFDRKMLRNFRKDGHNWKKKKDGKTVKEAHEHLKVGNEEKIHVYYAHGEDNTGFVRRCYWLLDKKYEHIVLVHYRDTSEVQDPLVTSVKVSPATSHSDSSTSRVLSEETDTGTDRELHTGPGTPSVGESVDIGENVTIGSHVMRLHEINTLDWDDLLVSSDPGDISTPSNEDISRLQQQSQTKMGNFNNNSLEPITESSSADMDLAGTGYPSEMIVNSGIQTQGPNFVTGLQDDIMRTINNGFQKQDSFGTWVNSVMTDSTDSLNFLPADSPLSTGHGSNLSAVTENYQSSTPRQLFFITDISPAWSYAAEETKVIIVGYFDPTYLHVAESRLFCVFGNSCVPAEMVQVGVFRCVAPPHNPGVVNLYLSLDGPTPISQILTFEYRPSVLENGASAPEDKSKWEEFQVQIRLARLLFSTSNNLNILSSKVPASALREAKKFVTATSSADKDWAYLIKSIGKNELSFPQAKSNLFEIILKNKLQEWLLHRVVDGSTVARDRQGQGVLHLCAILGYTWAVRPYSHSGLSLDFRDSRGWTALHWAAFYGREKMVAVLLSSGANPSLVADPTSEFPGGCCAADLASKNGYEGLGAYLAEKGLTEHFRLMALSGNISGSLQTNSTDSVNPSNLTEEQLCQKESLTAYRTAAEAASRIQTAFRENSFKLRRDAVQTSTPEFEARNIIAAMKIQHAFRNYETRKQIAAAARIQYRFRTWKIRKDFLHMRRQAIKIQSAFRALQTRRHYHKLLWSVGVLEKGILRWRQKRKGLRGLQVEPNQNVITEDKQGSDVEEDFFRISRRQAEDRIERSVVRVQALFRSFRAQQEYRRMKMAYDQVKLEEFFDSDEGFDG